MQLAQLLVFGGEEVVTEKPSDSFGSFREVTVQEEGLMLPAHAAVVLGITKQAMQDLLDRKRLKTWCFFEKDFVSAREVAMRKNSPRAKGGRPKTNSVPK